MGQRTSSSQSKVLIDTVPTGNREMLHSALFMTSLISSSITQVFYHTSCQQKMNNSLKAEKQNWHIYIYI